MRRVILLLLAAASLLPAAVPPANEWLLLLSDPPVVQRFPGRIERTRTASASYRQHLLDVQSNLRAQVEAQSVKVIGAVQHLTNGIFVRATAAQAAALRNLPEVVGVIPMRRFHLVDQLTLSNVQQAWNSASIGGAGNAGAGLKVAIIDTGIDQTHPSFQDSSLKAPAGFPKYDTYPLGATTMSDEAFTSNKIIVARSYVSSINAGTTPADSRPDDNSARDLIGHGTAVASVVAGVASSYFSSSLSGVAPKAFLGNYKIYGSPELGGGASESGILEALDDAVTDGMDVVNFSSGAPAYESSTATGAACGAPTGETCDPLAAAFENAMKLGEIICVVAAGNDGADGYRYMTNGSATYGTINSPAYTPSVIAAGGIQNDITYGNTINVSGANVPSDLATLTAFASSDSVVLPSPLTAPLLDVTQVGDDPELCTAPATANLTGDIALISRGCYFSTSVPNAQAAGAVGVVIVNNSSNPATLTNWGDLGGATIPALMISQSDGQNLKTFVDANSSTQATLNTEPGQVPASSVGVVPESVAYFASRGPSVGSYGLKPDLSAVATNFLLAAQDVDPFGELFSSTRYAVADGTSFATPMIAGTAALVKQVQPGLTPLQVKSVLVNSATLSGMLDQAGTGPAYIADVGAGLLQAQNAVANAITFNPSTVSFGSVAVALPAAQTIAVTNPTNAALTYTVSPTTGAPATQVAVTNSGSSISVRLTGSVPPAGRYEGVINVNGGPVPLAIPYMFVVPSNATYDIIPLFGTDFDGPVGQEIPAAYDGILGLRVIDRYGTSVSDVPVTWGEVAGGGSVLTGPENTDTATDSNGLALATVVLGPSAGTQEFRATVDGLTIDFTGNARNVPAINAGGIVDGAAFAPDRAVAPGSIISIFGTNLADNTASATQFPLPLGLTAGLSSVAFSFDVPSAGVSLPARFHYMNPGQINVQVPWELANYSSATVKVIVNYTYSSTYELPLATYAPGFFAYQANGQLYASALDSNLNVITASNPVSRGQTVALYLNGLGPVNNQPADGVAAKDATSTTVTTPTITIGGQQATVTFSGLAPGFADLYQVNATVPTGISAGTQQITCSIGGVSCQTVYLYVN